MRANEALKFGAVTSAPDGTFGYVCKPCNIVREGHHTESYALIGLITHCNWYHEERKPWKKRNEAVGGAERAVGEKGRA